MLDPSTLPSWASGWAPTVESRSAAISAHPVAGLAALLDAEPDLATPGAPLPPLWHWVALSQWPPGSHVGPDGHPRTGGFLPATPYPRRMWVGTAVELASAPAIGSDVVVDREVTDLVEKSGKQGDFALVTVTTTIRSSTGEPLVVERNQLAYRQPAAAGGAEQLATPAGPWLSRAGADAWRFAPDPVMLMWFSALTANAHRIHYDAPYATGVEGYPSLLVHGPLMAMILGEVVRRDDADRILASISVRALRPMYLGMTATITRTSDTTLALGADDGPAYMTAEVSYR